MWLITMIWNKEKSVSLRVCTLCYVIGNGECHCILKANNDSNISIGALEVIRLLYRFTPLASTDHVHSYHDNLIQRPWALCSSVLANDVHHVTKHQHPQAL
jgi:hypothetical protein